MANSVESQRQKEECAELSGSEKKHMRGADAHDRAKLGNGDDEIR